MLTLQRILKMWRTGNCAKFDAALDRHDNLSHRRGSDYSPQVDYKPLTRVNPPYNPK